jgi:HAE1 family hydrophobic/amphiphilic exporter-1
MPTPGSPVYVKDIASITDGIKEIGSVSRYNGVNGIGLLLKKAGGCECGGRFQSGAGKISSN